MYDVQREARLAARESNNPPLYQPMPGQVCKDAQARYAADSRTENQFAEEAKKFGGNCQRVKL